MNQSCALPEGVNFSVTVEENAPTFPTVLVPFPNNLGAIMLNALKPWAVFLNTALIFATSLDIVFLNMLCLNYVVLNIRIFCFALCYIFFWVVMLFTVLFLNVHLLVRNIFRPVGGLNS